MRRRGGTSPSRPLGARSRTATERLTVDGRSVGRLIQRPPDRGLGSTEGSSIGIVVTGAPLDHAACKDKP
jgi:L-aminopeptidase/D-esterase-like protein